MWVSFKKVATVSVRVDDGSILEVLAVWHLGKSSSQEGAYEGETTKIKDHRGL